MAAKRCVGRDPSAASHMKQDCATMHPEKTIPKGIVLGVETLQKAQFPVLRFLPPSPTHNSLALRLSCS